MNRLTPLFIYHNYISDNKNVITVEKLLILNETNEL